MTRVVDYAIAPVSRAVGPGLAVRSSPVPIVTGAGAVDRSTRGRVVHRTSDPDGDGAASNASLVGMVLVTGVVFVASGALAGGGARLLIGRIPRGARVPPPACEVAVALLWAVSGGLWAAGRLPAEWLPLVLGLGWLGVMASAVDIVVRRLPDSLTLPAFPLLIALVGPLGPAAAGRAAAGAAALFGAHLLVRLVAPDALGAGDVKIAAGIGAALGAVSWTALPLWAALAAGVTASVAVAGLVTGRSGLGARLPHGPAMCGSGWLVVVCAASGVGGIGG